MTATKEQELLKRAIDVSELWCGTMYATIIDYYCTELKEAVAQGHTSTINRLSKSITKMLDDAERDYEIVGACLS